MTIPYDDLPDSLDECETEADEEAWMERARLRADALHDRQKDGE